MKSMKKLIPAIAMLLVSAVLLGTSTFAWFSMNNKVTVTGMTITTSVQSNLLVGKVGEGTGTAGALVEEDLKATATQTVTGVLQPVSSVNGTAFYYVDTTKVNGDGSSTPGTGVYTLWDGSSTINGVASSKGYVLYDVVLKATATGAQTLSLTKFDITYTKAASESGVVKTFRAAVLASAAQTTLTAAEGAAVSLKTIIAPTSAAYFEQVSTVNQAVASTSALGDVSSFGSEAEIDDGLVAGDTKYYHVKVIVWLEGEDTQCTNETFLPLTGNWAVDIDFAFERAAVVDPPTPAVAAVTTINVVNAS